MIGIAAVIATAAITTVAFIRATYASGERPPHIGPYLQDLGATSVRIRWESRRPCRGAVEVERDGTMWTVEEQGGDTIRHEVLVDGLQPGVEYTYRVRWAGRSSAAYRFRTMPPEGTRRFTLVAYGDSRSDPDVHRRIVERIVAESPDIVIHTGDLVDDGRKERQWKPQFFDPAFPLVRSTPVITCLGNHEQNADHYYRYFHYPNNEAWFSYRWANVHFIVLASQLAYDEESEQTRWLERELQTPDAEWRVVFFHHPMFSCHPTRPINGNRWAWQDLFERHGVDIVLTGHDHYYHRTHLIGRAWDSERRGVLHITTAGGGAPLYPVEARDYTASALSAHHFLVLGFDGGTVSCRAIDVDGKEIDRFTLDQATWTDATFASWEMILWERRLREAIDSRPGVVALDGRSDESLELPALFERPFTIDYHWSGGSELWDTDRRRGSVRVEGETFRVPVVVARAPGAATFPLPELELTLADDPPPGRRLVNRSVTLSPLRLARGREVTAPASARSISVDGRLDEPIWREAKVLESFTRDGGTRLSERETVRVAHDPRGVVIGATMTSGRKRLVRLRVNSFLRDRDRILSRDEALIVAITVPGEKPVVHVLAADSSGAYHDSRNGDTAWNPDWQFRPRATTGGWRAEARIPWRVLGLDGPPTEPLRFNILRNDREERARSEWTPTYSSDGRGRGFDGWITFGR